MAQSIITQVSQETESYTPCPTPDTGLQMYMYKLFHCASVSVSPSQHTSDSVAFAFNGLLRYSVGNLLTVRMAVQVCFALRTSCAQWFCPRVDI